MMISGEEEDLFHHRRSSTPDPVICKYPLVASVCSNNSVIVQRFIRKGKLVYWGKLLESFVI